MAAKKKTKKRWGNKKRLPPLMRTQPIDKVIQGCWVFNYAQLGPRKQVTKKQSF